MEIEKCVMCGKNAVAIAPETNEPLCDKCNKINMEIANDKQN